MDFGRGAGAFTLRAVSKMLKASGALAFATLLSRILGMVREMAYYHFMGTTWVNDAFQYAFTVPNLFRRLLGEGALTAAFIPIFKEKEKNHGELEMWRAANAVISGLVILGFAIVAVVLVGISIALQVHQFNPQWDLMLRLLRIMFPYMLLACVAAAMIGILNARGHFFIPAMGATLLNIVMIASVYLVAPHFGVDLPKDRRLPVQIFALAYGVLVAGVAQMLFQMPTMWRDGFKFHWTSPWKNETVQRVLHQMIPGTIGVAAFQINVAMIQGVGLFVGAGIVSSYVGAVRLMELPQGMFGISLATYLLPTLSALATDKNYPEFRSTLRSGLSSLIFVNLIASVLLVVLAEPIVRLLFEYGKFDAFSTGRVSFALECLAPGLVAFSTVNILARAFYALGDTKTPMRISVLCLVINFIAACLMIVPLHEGGPGLANSFTSLINVGLLLFALKKKLAKLEMAPVRWALLHLIWMGAIAGIVAWMGWRVWAEYLGHATIPLRLGEVFVPAIVAGLIYLGLALWMKIPAAHEMLGFAFAKFRKLKK